MHGLGPRSRQRMIQRARTFRSRSLLPLFVMLAVAGSARAQQKSANSSCPPAARKDATVETLHGVAVADPYRWLEDQNSPETRAWIDAEDRCTEQALRSLPGRAEITKRLSELMKVDSFQPPVERNGFYFFERRAADQDLSVIYRRRAPEGAEEVLVDPHPMSPDHSTSVVLLGVSRDASIMAYGVRAGGQDELTIHFLDTNARKDLPDVLPPAVYFALDLQPDNRGFYYSRKTPAGPRVYHHPFGEDPAKDSQIFGKGYGQDKIIGTSLSEDGRHLLIELLYGTGETRTELYFLDVERGGSVRPIVNDIEAVFNGQIEGDTLLVFTNWNAPHWRIFAAPMSNPSREAWREVIPQSDAAIQRAALMGGKVVVSYVRNAASDLKVFEPTGKPIGPIPLPSLGSVTSLTGNWKNSRAFFTFESFNYPPTILQYDLQTAKLQTWAKRTVPIDSDAYAVEQVWCESKDKTRVPIFLFYRKGLPRDANRPVLLTGYGGFAVSDTPAFNARNTAFVDRGGLFALVTLRGGGEFGEDWHRAGMLDKKQNVFDDFCAAAEWLIANHYTNPRKLAIIGGSNGGLLVGAAMTQRPDLFQAVVCTYPLLDMLRYQKFIGGSWWVAEYGSADDPAQFNYLYAYSPYHHVKDGTKYPATLFVTGDGDTRVAPLHARKMAARLQATTASDRPILLLYDTKSGHSGGRPLNKLIEEYTDILSFLFWQLGVKAP